MNHLTHCKDYFLRLQAQIVSGLEQYEQSAFLSDSWQREEGGGGLSRLIEHGQVFERAGVLFSHVHGSQLPSSASAQRPELAGRPWEAMGVSLVIHPKNPHVPTAHANVRVFYAKAQTPDDEDVYWFGGGMDLTPYYPKLDDAIHFHRQCKAALDPFGHELYPNFKSWCDRYFYLKHRQETRGVGGIFFDDYKGSDFEQAFALTQSVGDHFVRAYLPIVENNYRQAYTEAQRDFQAYRRGRYVEFNLVYDRGTLFGLQSGGRTESILMSMPPNASWRYDWQPEAGSQESILYDFLTPRDWLNEQS